MEDLSSTSGNRKLDNLIDDVYQFYLLKHLNLRDLLNLRLVSKSLHNIVDSYQIKDLCFLDYKDPSIIYERFSEIENIYNIMSWRKITLLTYPPDNLLRLKSLRIYGDDMNSSIKLKILNKFVKLQKLHIERVKIRKSGGQLLRLPDLKEMKCRFYTRIEFANCVLIDAPNLERLDLDCREHESFGFKHPRSIRQLQVKGHCRVDLLAFENLECLTISSKYENDLILKMLNDVKRLKNLKNLKKLRYNTTSYLMIDEDINKLKDLFEWKKKNLEIVLCGVKIKEISKFEERKSFSDDFKFQLNNYGELEDGLDFIVDINYSPLMRLLPNRPSDFFNKYSNIRVVNIYSKVVDENRLLTFISECKKLNRLYFNRTALGQAFFDQLPANSSLESLEIIEKEVNLNFEFIMQMIYLRNLCTNQFIELGENLNLNDLKYLKVFQFYIFENGKMEINKKDHDRYWIPYSFYDLTFDELVKNCNNLR